VRSELAIVIHERGADDRLGGAHVPDGDLMVAPVEQFV
jgi:hypothetical protein